jgi:WD40 repeat protein
MNPSSLLAVVGLLSAGLAHGQPAPRPLVSSLGIDLGANVAGAAFCDTSQRAVLALATGDLVAIDATGSVTKLPSLGRQVGNVQLTCDRKDRILAPIGSTLTFVDGGSTSTEVGTFRYVRLTQLLDDGTTAIVGDDGTIWRWDGTQLTKDWTAPIQTSQQPGRLALRGDGKALVVAAHDGMKIYNADGSQLTGPVAHNVSWYGKDLVYVQRAGLARWAPTHPLTSATILDAKIRGYQLALGGRRVIITSATDAEIRELDAAGAVVGSAIVKRLPSGFKQFAFGASSWGVVARGQHAHVFDLTRSSVMIDEQHPLEPPRALAFSPDGASLAMAGSDGDVLVAKVRNALVHRLVAPGKRAYGNHLVWGNDGIATSGEGGYLMWDRKGAATSHRLSSLFGFTSAGEPIERDRMRGFIVHRRSGPMTLGLATEIGEEPIHRIEIDGKHAVVKRSKHIELYWIGANDAPVLIAKSHDLRFSTHVGLAGKTPRAFYVDDRKVHMLDASGDKELAILGGFATALVVSKDRRRVAVANNQGGISIFDGDTGKHVVGLLVDGHVTALAFSSDGKRLAVASPRGVTIHPIRQGVRPQRSETSSR